MNLVARGKYCNRFASGTSITLMHKLTKFLAAKENRKK